MDRIFKRSTRLALTALTSSLLLGAGSPDVNTIAEHVSADVRDLGDASSTKVDSAEIRLLSGGAEEFKAIEAAAGHPGLSNEAAGRLKRIIGLMKPLQAARLKVAASEAAMSDWQTKDALAAYDAAGKKDPKWDAALKDAMTAYFRDDGASEASRAALMKAVKLGCTDPYLLCLAARSVKMLPNPDWTAADKYLSQASVSIQSTSYPPHIKFAVDIEYGGQLARHGEPIGNDPNLPPPPEDMGAHPMMFNQRTKGAAASLLHKGVAIWPRVVKEAGIPSKLLESMAMHYVNAAAFPKAVDETALDQIVAPLNQGAPESLASLNVEARIRYSLAWKERGGKAASQVPKEQFDKFFDHLQKAEALLATSAKKFPDDVESSDLMIAITLDTQGKRGRESINTWFKHAIAIDPDDADAYRQVMRASLPQWGGTAGDIQEFVKQCLLPMNYHGRIPFIVTEFYDQVAHLDPTIWRDAKTWDSINKLYTPWLAAYPDDAVARSRYTYLACQCHQWKDAKAQFNILGDKAVDSQFGGSAILWRNAAIVH